MSCEKFFVLIRDSCEPPPRPRNRHQSRQNHIEPPRTTIHLHEPTTTTTTATTNDNNNNSLRTHQHAQTNARVGLLFQEPSSFSSKTLKTAWILSSWRWWCSGPALPFRNSQGQRFPFNLNLYLELPLRDSSEPLQSSEIPQTSSIISWVGSGGRFLADSLHHKTMSHRKWKKPDILVLKCYATVMSSFYLLQVASSSTTPWSLVPRKGQSQRLRCYCRRGRTGRRPRASPHPWARRPDTTWTSDHYQLGISADERFRTRHTHTHRQTLARIHSIALWSISSCAYAPRNLSRVSLVVCLSSGLRLALSSTCPSPCFHTTQCNHRTTVLSKEHTQHPRQQHVLVCHAA